MSGRITKNELNDSLTNDIYKIASQSELGRVKVDNDTILVDELGTISAKANTTSYYVEAKQGTTNNVYELSIPKITEYVSGMKILLKVLENNKTGTVKININNLGEKDLYYQTYIASVQNSGALEANKIYELVYSGDRFNLLGYPFISQSLLSTQLTTVASSSAVNELYLTKAEKNLPEEAQLTIQNGANGFVRYFKDDFGIVHCEMFISGGTLTANTVIGTFPVGYRPRFGSIYVDGITYLSGSITDTNPIRLEILNSGELRNTTDRKNALVANFSFRSA